MKKCSMCEELLDEIFFSPMKSGRDGLQARCKPCINQNYRDKYCAIREKEKRKEKPRKIIENFWKFGGCKNE